jgi:Na+-transporting NADH:ubiquinone oxidoreductase subunit C
MEFTPARTIGFATIVCLVCAVLVSSAAVGLKERQKENEALDRQKKVLDVAGLLKPWCKKVDTDQQTKDSSKPKNCREVEPGQETPKPPPSTPEGLKKLYEERVQPTLYSLLKDKDGCQGIDVSTYDQIKASKDSTMSKLAPAGNKAKVQRVPNCGLMYKITSVKDKNTIETIIIPVEGKGLWSTLYGFIALDTNGIDIKGLTFYKHAETPGLGGEVDNPKWKAKWVGKKAFKSGSTKPALYVQKGVAKNEYSVDGLSGATLTSNGVTHLLQFWLDTDRFGSYFSKQKGSGS